VLSTVEAASTPCSEVKSGRDEMASDEKRIKIVAFTDVLRGGTI
jgi:hypothetical protein